MKRCTIIGKTNVGKTLFLINFAQYLGAKSLDIESIKGPDFRTLNKYSFNTAISQLVDSNFHKTRCIQSVTIDIPMGKGKKRIRIMDTGGLVEGIHSNIEIRKTISQTLGTIRDSDIILHVIDAYAANNKTLPNSMGEVDYQIAQFAQLKRGYAILANKMDIPGSKDGLLKIKQEFQGNVVFPISALHKKGFKEVKTFVAHNI